MDPQLDCHRPPPHSPRNKRQLSQTVVPRRPLSGGSGILRPVSWLTDNDTATTSLESVLGLRPELLARYRRFYGALWDEQLVPRRLLELARLCIAAVHDCAAEKAIRDAEVTLTERELDDINRFVFDDFPTVERDVLRVAEKIPFQHHQITDEEVGALKAQLDEATVVSLMTAMALFDTNCRWRLAFDVATEAATVAAPASGDSHLF